MYDRLLNIDPNSQFSVFILGPRGTGKTAWLKMHFADALYFDLLDAAVYTEFLAQPTRLSTRIPDHYEGWVIIDEVQKVPALLNEVHRLIESRGLRFILTGSSARSLRKKGVNLLAGRALTYHMHPLTTIELGDDFDIRHSLQYGHLPAVISHELPKKYLSSYVKTYLREEVLQEGITRQIEMFARFLETASFSQGEVLNYTDIARETGINRHTVRNFFDILDDLLIASRLPVFAKRAKRAMTQHPKFYYFDVGIYQSIRPKGLLDTSEEADGAALETLFLQEAKAINDYYDLNYQFFYWRTATHLEVDFVIYGEQGFHAFEIKRKANLNLNDFKGLKAFAKDYPQAMLYLLYGGNNTYYEGNIKVIPFAATIKSLRGLLRAPL